MGIQLFSSRQNRSLIIWESKGLMITSSAAGFYVFQRVSVTLPTSGTNVEISEKHLNIKVEGVNHLLQYKNKVAYYTIDDWFIMSPP